MRAPIAIVASSRSAEALQNRTERERLERIAQQLSLVTTRVAADVDEHQSKMQEVSESLSELEEGIDGDIVFNAVASLIKANEKMQFQLGEAEVQIRQQEEAIENAVELALTDGLTGLNNRRAFDRHLNKRLALKDFDTTNPTTLMLIDVDHFKKFNDVYGHRIGDEVLKHVATLLAEQFEGVGFVARYGGEEFAVIFDGRTANDIKDLADEIRNSLGQREFVVDNQSLRITASGGLAQRQASDTVESWIERSDSALYTAKHEGRNRTYWMDGDIANLVGKERIDDQSEQEGSSDDPTQSTTKMLKTVDDADDQSDEILDAIQVDEVALDVTSDDAPNLPTIDELRENAASNFKKLQAERIPFCIVAVQVEADTDEKLWQSLTLSSIQGSIRGIDADRIAFDDNKTFIICMPSTDRSIADERGESIKAAIRRATTERMGVAFDVTTASVCARSTETFDQVLTRAMLEVESSPALA